MIDGFPVQRNNKFGGRDIIPYPEATFLEKDAALATSCNGGGVFATRLPDKVSKAGPKEHRTKLAAIHTEFVKTEKACEPYSVGNAEHWFEKWKKEAAESGEPGDAPTNKNEVKDRMRHMRRVLRSNFREKHFRAYHSMVKALLESVIPALTKLIEAEDAQEIERLKAFGIIPQYPSPVVAGLFAVRRALVMQLVTAEGSLENEQGISGLDVNGDLLRMLGVEI
jgi:hypothetical protein